MKLIEYLLARSVLVCYGATAVILIEQWTTVGNVASWFRVIAWQITLGYVLIREYNKHVDH